MKKIIVIALILMVVLNVVVLLSSLSKKAEAEKQESMSRSVKIELKEIRPLFFVSLVKF